MSDISKSSSAMRRSYAQAAGSRPPPINTNVARGAPPGAGTASSAQDSIQSASTAATSLYPPSSSTWSPGPFPDVTQSATIPKKVNWDSELVEIKATQRPKVATPLTSALRKEKPPKASVGLGLRFGDTDAVNKAAAPKLTLDTTEARLNTSYHYQHDNIPEPSTSPYSSVNEAADQTAGTYPLMQYPFGASRDFANQHRDLSGTVRSPLPTLAEEPYNLPVGTGRKVARPNDAANTTRNAPSVATNLPAVAEEPSWPDSALGSDADVTVGSPGTVYSDLTKIEMPKMGTAASFEWVEQRNHPQSFTRNLKSKNMGYWLNVVYHSAYYTLKALNPERMKLPSTARAICIKTDFVTNIHAAVQCNRWATMEKVGNRIMRLWDARKSDDEKLYFVFSVNGYKSYCGLAEMSGPFVMDGNNLESFQGANDGSNTWGTIPITWLYIKNVAYGWFNHITHDHNDGAITNMWNGMHYPSEAGRAVIKVFVERPHFTNVVCWVANNPYHPDKVPQPWQIDPELGGKGSRNFDGRGRKGEPIKNQRMGRLIEDGRPAVNRDNAGRTSDIPQNTQSRGAMVLLNGRGMQNRTGEALGDARAHQPTPNRQPPMQQSQAPVTPSNFDGHVSPAPRTARVMQVQAIFDDHGNFEVITPEGHHLPAMRVQPPNLNTPTHPYSGYPGHHAPMHHPANPGTNNRHINPGFIGSVPGGARYVSGPVNFRGHASPMVPPTIRRMQSEAAMGDVFGTPVPMHHAAHNERMGSPAINVHPPSNNGYGNIAALKRAAPSANFTPQRSDSLSSYTPGYNTGTNAASTMNPPSSVYKPNGGGNIEIKEELSLEEKRLKVLEAEVIEAELHAEMMRAYKDKAGLSTELARRRYKLDARRSPSDYDGSRYNGSEPDGMNAFVSTSSLEKAKISPVPSLKGSVLGSVGGFEAVLADQVDKLVASPPPSMVDSSVGGGVQLK